MAFKKTGDAPILGPVSPPEKPVEDINKDKKEKDSQPQPTAPDPTSK